MTDGWTPPGTRIPWPTWRDVVACAVMLVAALSFWLLVLALTGNL